MTDPTKYRAGYFHVGSKYNKSSDIAANGKGAIGCSECGDKIVKFIK